MRRSSGNRIALRRGERYCSAELKFQRALPNVWEALRQHLPGSRNGDYVAARAIEGYPGFIGFHLDGNADTHGTDSSPNGNASSTFRDCVVDASLQSTQANPTAYSQRSVGSIGFKLSGTNVADLSFDNCNTSWTDYGWSVDFSSVASSPPGSDEDIFLLNPVSDFYSAHGIVVNGSGSDGNTMVTISGGLV